MTEVLVAIGYRTGKQGFSSNVKQLNESGSNFRLLFAKHLDAAKVKDGDGLDNVQLG